MGGDKQCLGLSLVFAWLLRGTEAAAFCHSPEWSFATPSFASQGQRSVAGMLGSLRDVGLLCFLHQLIASSHEEHRFISREVPEVWGEHGAKIVGNSEPIWDPC